MMKTEQISKAMSNTTPDIVAKYVNQLGEMVVNKNYVVLGVCLGLIIISVLYLFLQILKEYNGNKSSKIDIEIKTLELKKVKKTVESEIDVILARNKYEMLELNNSTKLSKQRFKTEYAELKVRELKAMQVINRATKPNRK